MSATDTVASLRAIIGRRAMWTTPTLAMRVAVTILDVRSRYGRLDYRVSPVAGTGDMWVEDRRVTLERE